MYVHKVSSVEAVDFHILRISIHIASFPNHAHQHIVNYLSITINIPSTTSLFSTISMYIVNSTLLSTYHELDSIYFPSSHHHSQLLLFQQIINSLSIPISIWSTPSPFPSAYHQLRTQHAQQHKINFLSIHISIYIIKSHAFPSTGHQLPHHTHQLPSPHMYMYPAYMAPLNISSCLLLTDHHQPHLAIHPVNTFHSRNFPGSHYIETFAGLLLKRSSF